MTIWANGDTYLTTEAIETVLPERLSDAKLKTAFAPAPGTLRGVPITAYGDSYLAGFPIVDLVARRLAATPVVNRSVGGTTMTGLMSLLPTGPSAWVPGTKGVVLVKSVINSIINQAADRDPIEKIGYANALRTALCIFRSQAWVPDTDPSNVYGGTGWTTSAPPNIHGSGVRVTTGLTDYVEITTTAREISLMFLAFPPYLASNISSGGGTNFTVTVNGQVHGQDSTIARCALSGYSYHHYAYRITGLTGTSTIRVTHGATAGTNELFYDGYLVAADQPPGVVVCKDAIPSDAGLTINGTAANRTAANLDAFNAIIDQVCTGFDALVQVADPRPGVNNGIDYEADKLHPNPMLSAKYASAIVAAARKLPASSGIA